MRVRVVATIVSCLLAGCGGGEGSESEEAKVRKAFADYDAAVKSGNLEALKARVAGEKAAELSKPEAPQLLELAARMRPANATIVACSVSGDRADLQLTGKLEGQTAKATATLVREGGSWRLSEESWSVTIDISGASAAPEPVVAPPMEAMSPGARKLVDAVASSDAAAGSAAWSDIGTRHESTAA